MIFVIGSLAGGLALGAGLAGVAYGLRPLFEVRLGLLLGVSAISVLAIVLPAMRLWIPQRYCQVATGILNTEPRAEVAFRWGMKLGTGLGSYLVTPGFYALVVVLVAPANPLLALIMSAVYGVARGLTIARFALLRARQRRAGREGDPGAGMEPVLRGPLAAVIVFSVLVTTLAR